MKRRPRDWQELRIRRACRNLGQRGTHDALPGPTIRSLLASSAILFQREVFAPKRNPRPPFNAVAAGMQEIAADDAAPVIEQGESWNESMK